MLVVGSERFAAAVIREMALAVKIATRPVLIQSNALSIGSVFCVRLTHNHTDNDRLDQAKLQA